MNRIEIGTAFNAGQFVMYREMTAICQLGDEIEVVPRTKRLVDGRLVIVLELQKTKIHADHGVFEADRMAYMPIPNGDSVADKSTRTILSYHQPRCDGKKTTLGLQEYKIGRRAGHVLTIDGYLWDGRLMHVKDIIV